MSHSISRESACVGSVTYRTTASYGKSVGNTSGATVGWLASVPRMWKRPSTSTDLGERTSTLVINADMSGTVNFGEFGSFPLDYVDIVNGNELWWGIAASFGDQQIYIEFAGKLEGETFSGGMWVADQEMAQITATKKK